MCVLQKRLQEYRATRGKRENSLPVRIKLLILNDLPYQAVCTDDDDIPTSTVLGAFVYNFVSIALVSNYSSLSSLSILRIHAPIDPLDMHH